MAKDVVFRGSRVPAEGKAAASLPPSGLFAGDKDAEGRLERRLGKSVEGS